MWELRVRLESAAGTPLAGHRVTLAFQLRLAGVGAELMMPAEATGVTDLDGRANLSLPSPEGMGDTLRLLVRDGDGRLVHEAELPRAQVGAELLARVGAPQTPSALTVELLAGGRALANVEVVLLGRAEGASSFSLVLAGRTDAAGRVQGPYPQERFAEASAMVRVDGNQTLPVALSEGALPARVVLSLQEGAAKASAAPAPAAAPPPATAPPQAPGAEVPALVSSALPSRADEDDDEDDEVSGRRARRRRSHALPGLGAERLMLGLLALVVVIGAFLRLYRLDGPSLWNDELSSWRRSSYDTVAKVITKGAMEDVHPPGYYLILHMVQKVSDSEWALRFPSAVAGVLSLVVIFLLGRRIWSDKEGLIAAALMAVLYAPIFYSQEARAYALLMLFSMLSVMAWMVMLREVERKGRVTLEQALWYVLPASALTYLHYFGVLMVGLQGVGAFVFVAARRHRQGAVGSIAGTYVAVALLYLPWIGPFFQDLTQSKSWMEDPGEGGKSALWHYLKFLFNHQGALAAYMVALVLGAGFWQVTLAKSWNKLHFSLRTRWGMVALWFVMPFAITWLQSVAATPVLSNRNLLIAAPAAYLLVARAITSLPIPGRLQAMLAVLTIGLAAGGFARKSYYTKPSRQQYREVVQYVVEHHDQAPNAAIIVTGPPQHFNYYFEHLGSDRVCDISASSEDDIAKVKKLFAENGPKAVWRLRAGRAQQTPVDAWLAERFQAVDEQEYFEGSLTLYRRSGKRAEGEEGAAPAAPGDAAPAEGEAAPKKKGKAQVEEAADTGAPARPAKKAKAEQKPKDKAGKAPKRKPDTGG